MESYINKDLFVVIMKIEIELKRKPKNVRVIEGFPGFGLVGTITTEFLIDHLNAERIGTIWFNELSPLVAVHEGKMVEPLGIFYAKKYNLIIVHALADIKGMEWKIVDALSQLCKMLSAKEMISIEGVGSMGAPGGKSNAYYYSKVASKWKNVGVSELNEGIVIGVTAALMMKFKQTPLSCVFAETHSNLPDSRAAAKVVEVLDKYLGLKVDYKPLLKKAKEFESKIKDLVKQSQNVKDVKAKKDLSYLG